MRISLTLIILTAFLSCSKNNTVVHCSPLKNGIATNDKEVVKAAISQFINSLPSEQYNKPNIEKLVASISSDCEINAELLCFDCIFTLPSQTEIRLSFESEGVTFYQIIDISYTRDNKMIFHNMHE